MAVVCKDSNPKRINGKRTIKVDNIHIENGELHDEEGSIGERIEAYLPTGMSEFTLKISFELPDEDEEESDEDDSPF